MENKALYFTSSGCSVCKALKPKVKTLLKESYPKLAWQEVNMAEEQKLAAKYGVFTAPVLILILEGKEYFRWIRAFSITEIREKTDRVYSLLFDE